MERVEMNRTLTTSICLTMLLAFSSTQAWDPKGKEDDVAKGQEAIDALLKSDSTMQRYFDAAAGYVVIPTVGKAGLGIGGARGKGLLYEGGNRRTASSSFLKMRAHSSISKKVTMNSARRHLLLRLRLVPRLMRAMQAA
jgi:lipid-binding SYLF domain-containing protein